MNVPRIIRLAMSLGNASGAYRRMALEWKTPRAKRMASTQTGFFVAPVMRGTVADAFGIQASNARPMQHNVFLMFNPF